MAGSVFQRRDGRWVASVVVNGRRKVQRYAATREVAEAALEAVRLEYGLDDPGAAANPRLGDWLARWLDGKAIRPATHAAYQRACVAWTGELGQVRLGLVTPARLEATLRRWDQQGVGARTREQRWAVLHGALGDAVRLGLLATNPLDRVARPRYHRPEQAPWTLTHARAFLETALASRRAHADLLAFLLLSGLRVSEALGLTDADLLEGRRIVIRRAVVWVGGVAHAQPPKTAAGRRVVSLPEPAWAILEARLAGGSGPVFRTASGSPPSRNNLGRLMRALCAEAGVPPVSVRTLRRVHSAVLVRGGLDPKALQSRLGHTRASISLDLYAFQLQDDGVEDAWERGLR